MFTDREKERAWNIARLGLLMYFTYLIGRTICRHPKTALMIILFVLCPMAVGGYFVDLSKDRAAVTAHH